MRSLYETLLDDQDKIMDGAEKMYEAMVIKINSLFHKCIDESHTSGYPIEDTFPTYNKEHIGSMELCYRDIRTFDRDIKTFIKELQKITTVKVVRNWSQKYHSIYIQFTDYSNTDPNAKNFDENYLSFNFYEQNNVYAVEAIKELLQ